MASKYPQCIVYRGHETFLTNDLKTFFPTVFIGIRTSKNMVTEFSIPKDDYFVVKKLSDGSYEESTLTYTRSKVLIKMSWFEAFMADPHQKIKDAPRVAPPLLELTDNDRFVDDDGNVFEVEIRGERHEDDVRFRGRDVERVFEMENLVDDAQKTDSGYVKGEHYEIMLVGIKYTKGGNNRRLYFTYKGILKIVSRSRSYNISNVTKFMNTPFMKELQQQSQNMVILMPYKEQQTIQAIQEAFPEEILHTQYTIGPYRVDLYIEGKMVIECDENNHLGRDPLYETKREQYIRSKLKCLFFRYNPDEVGFSIYRLIKDITRKLDKLEIIEAFCQLGREQEQKIQELNQQICLLNLTQDI